MAWNALSALAASGLLSLIVALFLGFSRITPGNAAAFRLLLAAAVLSALMSSSAVLLHLAHARRSADLSRDVAGQLKSLEARIPSIDWSYDAAEHDSGLYERIRKAIENPRTAEIKILTIYRDPSYEEVSDAQREAIREYYRSLEGAVASRRDFTYDRLVVLRAAFRGRKSARDLLHDLATARPDFIEHYRKIATSASRAVNAHAEIRFYADTGRLFDISFALALDERNKPLTLLLEISVTRPADGSARSEHPALGLLALENPSPQLADAFLLAHQALRSGSTSVEHITDRTLRDVLRI